MESKQVLSIEQMQHLQELGLDTSNASMRWLNYNGINAVIPNNFHLPTTDKDYKICDVYTLQDVLDALPKEIKPNTIRYWLRIDLVDECVYYFHDDYNLTECRKKVFSYDGKDSLIDAAYKMLCWCIENGHVETDKNE